MTENILDDQTPDDNIDLSKPLIDQLVGDGKKFKTVEDLARGKLESDRFVPTLTRQLDELRDDLRKTQTEAQSRASLQELVDRLTQQQKLTSSEEPNANEVLDGTQPAIKPEQIDERVLKIVGELETQRKQNDNANLVKAKLREQYGNNYSAVVKEQIQTLGITEDYFNEQSRLHPEVVFRLLELDKPATRENFQTPPKSQRNDNFSPSTTKRTQAWYQKLKVEKPDLYRDPKTTVQMHKDAQAMGPSFFDLN